jgi:hypothetical protein
MALADSYPEHALVYAVRFKPTVCSLTRHDQDERFWDITSLETGEVI